MTEDKRSQLGDSPGRPLRPLALVGPGGRRGACGVSTAWGRARTRARGMDRPSELSLPSPRRDCLGDSSMFANAEAVGCCKGSSVALVAKSPREEDLLVDPTGRAPFRGGLSPGEELADCGQGLGTCGTGDPILGVAAPLSRPVWRERSSIAPARDFAATLSADWLGRECRLELVAPPLGPEPRD